MNLNQLRYSLFLLFGAVLYFFNGYSSDVVNAICLVLIALFGIPHGAVDHRIHLSTSDSKNAAAYILKYVLIGAAYVLWWVLDPTKALVIFLFLSAYHFGQEALENAELKHPGAFGSLVWGLFILVAPMLFNFNEVKPYLEAITSLQLPTLSIYLTRWVPLVIVIATLVHLFYQRYVGGLSRKNVTRLLVFVTTIIAAHLVLPFVLAFTLYFVFFHSLNAFTHQFNWLQKHKENYRLQNFIADLSGFSFLAIFGIAFLLWILDPKEMTRLITYFFILTSLITLPHAITLDQFYRFKRTKISHQEA